MAQLIANFISLQTILKFHLRLTMMLVSSQWYGTNPSGNKQEGKNIASIVYKIFFQVEEQKFHVVSENLHKASSID